MKKISPYFILLAGILWGCMGIFVRGLNARGLYTLEVVFVRALITCLVMGIVLLFYKKELFKIKLKDVWCFVGTGICSIVLFNFCYFKAISIMSLSIAAILLYTAPAMVMVMSFFLFKEKMTAKIIVSLIMTFVGCVLVTGVLEDRANSLSFVGIMLGLGAGFGYALYSIFGRFAIERGYHTLTITFYTFLFASIGAAFLADVPLVFSVITTDMTALAYAIGMGFVVTIFPYLLYTLGLINVENGPASIIASVEPVMATVVGFIIFKETISIVSICGISLVLVALFICNLPDRNSDGETNKRNNDNS